MGGKQTLIFFFLRLGFAFFRRLFDAQVGKFVAQLPVCPDAARDDQSSETGIQQGFFGFGGEDVNHRVLKRAADVVARLLGDFAIVFGADFFDGGQHGGF